MYKNQPKISFESTLEETVLYNCSHVPNSDTFENMDIKRKKTEVHLKQRIKFFNHDKKFVKYV